LEYFFRTRKQKTEKLQQKAVEQYTESVKAVQSVSGGQSGEWERIYGVKGRKGANFCIIIIMFV